MCIRDRELNGGMEGSAGFERNETNPLETDLVIIDEMSMVDIKMCIRDRR